MLPTHFRSLCWSAHTCNYSQADVYIGIAPGGEDALLRQMYPPLALATYPGRELPITQAGANSELVPLRLYALRSPEACSVEQLGDDGSVDGFHRVKLHFRLPSRPRAADPALSPILIARPVPPVVAFLITLGLSIDDERNFFEHIVADFLDHSWSSLPRLLREVGCAEPSEA